MIMTPNARKLALATHVATSVGSLGAVAAFLALALSGLASHDAGIQHAVYPAMELITWFVIVPVIVASLLSGIVSSLGTPWGLFRHYWVLVKLLLTVFALVVLLVQLRPIRMAAAAATGTGGDLGTLKIQLVVHAAGGLLVLLVATALSVYKPRGMTRYGVRRTEPRPSSPP